MSEFSAAYAEVARVVQPDADPVLTHGDGETPDPTMELDSIILGSVRGTVWAASADVEVGDRVIPATRNGHYYVVTGRGALDSTEPSWPSSDYGVVTSGTATLEEAGRLVGSLYDVRKAKYEGCLLKADKCGDRVDYSADGANYSETQTADYWLKRARMYAPVGIA